ncbi:TonB-dependent receptor [Hymenobacter sp. 5516J-16]|uniref:SusC/RagA family TonB-linked outer membrane protein n=1 Tax=Hymenobacter sp. 5516J-16 TaxID=2932253 RepID=UPI001FD225FB|nr:TonB-dependent receptor [Hymenobacter sp. 5516J-16]UOQ77507.1 TonB-dependent receptor [Hymenobacter sp. 5516J-16]
MNHTPTRLGGSLASTALSACALLLPAPGATASAQLLASNHLPTQRTETPAETVLLKDLLGRWESQYGVTIFYESNLVRNKRVTARPEVASPLEEKLTEVLPQAELTFKKLRSDYYVVVAPTAGPVTTAAGKTVQADVPVSGRVTQSNGEGLPGVTVVVKGTSIGTSTSSDGSFSLNVPEGSTLVFSSIGFLSREVPVTGANPALNISLSTDAKALDEVVVVGYGTQSRQELTTSVTSVSAEELTRQPVAGFDQALQGKAPGVQVTSPSGAPGAGINVRIRGNSSISLTGSPLYVIDGVPILPTYEQELAVGGQRPNPLNALNPQDIESIDVLKDGAAAAIYGLRASNGVVVITTKKGKLGKPQVGLSVYYGQQRLRKKLDVLNSRQFAEYYNEALVNAGRPAAFTDLNNLPTATDWQEEIYRPAGIQSYQLNISGATEQTRYYVSGGYFKQDGISLNSGFDRYNFKINVDQKLGQRFRMGTNLNLSRTFTNGSVRSELGIGNSGTVLGALAQIPTIPVRTADGRYGTNPFQAFDNPVGNLLETNNKAVIYQAIGNAYGELDILKNLTLRSSLGLDFRTQNENQFITRDYPGTSNADPATRGSGATSLNQQVIWLLENTLTYNPNLGDRHNLTLLAGQSVQESDRFTSSASGKGYPANSVPYLSAVSQFDKPSSYQDQWGLMSFFGRAIYNYDERYLATLSMRADGSSKFREGNKFGYFPALGLGWRVSKEAFFPQNTAVSELKLRGSIGATGNQEFYTYQRFSRYGTGFNYQNGGSILGGIAPTNIGNNDVKWESTTQYDAGIDLGLFSDRLTLTLDGYLKKTSDLLTLVSIPLSTGAQDLSIIQNVGKIENKGFEFGLNSTNLQGANGGFSWTTNFNFTINRNKVLDLGTIRNEQGEVEDRRLPSGNGFTLVGQPLGVFYGWQVQGIFQNQDEISSAAKQDNAAPGDIRFRDLNNDGIINDKDRTVIGNPNPKAIAGVTNNFGYKGLELSVFFQGSFGNDIYNQNRETLEGMADPLNQSTRILNRWTPTNTNTDVPRAVRNDPNNNRRMSDRFIEDGSYVRLKNLTLAYNLPSTLTRKAAISNLRVYVTGQNLITWTDYSGYDPEVSSDPQSNTGFGRDFGVYPQARTYTVGLNATF